MMADRSCIASFRNVLEVQVWLTALLSTVEKDQTVELTATNEIRKFRRKKNSRAKADVFLKQLNKPRGNWGM